MRLFRNKRLIASGLLSVAVCGSCVLASRVRIAKAQVINGSGQTSSARSLGEPDFLFKGRVMRLATSDVGQWPSSPGVAIVLVEKILGDPCPPADDSCSAFANAIINQPVTVRLTDPSSVSLNSEYVFTTKIIFDQEHLAVAELQHQNVTTAPTVIDGEIAHVTAAPSAPGRNVWSTVFNVSQVYRGYKVSPEIPKGSYSVDVQTFGVKPVPGEHMTLLVQTLGRVVHARASTPQQADPVGTDIQASINSVQRRRTEELCRQSSAVVGAKVVEVGESELARPKAAPLWHEPELKTAAILVTESYKGNLRKGSIERVLFIESGDAGWRSAPHLVNGEIANLFLRPAKDVGIHSQGNQALGVFQNNDINVSRNAIDCEQPTSQVRTR